MQIWNNLHIFQGVRDINDGLFILIFQRWREFIRMFRKETMKSSRVDVGVAHGDRTRHLLRARRKR